MSVEKRREEFEAWAHQFFKEYESRHPSVYRDEQDYSLLPYRNAWAAWQASREALLEKQAQEQEEFLAHLADFEQEDTLHG